MKWSPKCWFSVQIAIADAMQIGRALYEGEVGRCRQATLAHGSRPITDEISFLLCLCWVNVIIMEDEMVDDNGVEKKRRLVLGDGSIWENTQVTEISPWSSLTTLLRPPRNKFNLITNIQLITDTLFLFPPPLALTKHSPPLASPEGRTDRPKSSLLILIMDLLILRLLLRQLLLLALDIGKALFGPLF